MYEQDAIDSDATEIDGPTTWCANCEADLIPGETYRIKSGNCRGDLNCKDCAECMRDECDGQVELIA